MRKRIWKITLTLTVLITAPLATACDRLPDGSLSVYPGVVCQEWKEEAEELSKQVEQDQRTVSEAFLKDPFFYENLKRAHQARHNANRHCRNV